jgi:uncharacterized cupredoxin-like copper-binding protein
MVVATLLKALVGATTAPAPAVAPDDYAYAALVEIDLSNFKFTPGTINLKAGQPVILHLFNRSSFSHDFTAREFFARASIRPEDVHFIRDGKVSLRGSQQAVVALTPAVGRYPVTCSHMFHKSFGMHGEVVVTW